ncbi:hypothetical protein Tco_0513592 [Tanacetum coccineum]
MKNPSNRCECAITELLEFIQAHQLVSLELILIDDSLRVFVCSVWCQFGDVRSESLMLGDIKFLLVAFDSQLKVFHPFKNDNDSDEYPQCHIYVEDDIPFKVLGMCRGRKRKNTRRFEA